MAIRAIGGTMHNFARFIANLQLQYGVTPTADKASRRATIFIWFGFAISSLVHVATVGAIARVMAIDLTTFAVKPGNGN